MKLIKSMKSVKCSECDAAINKGDRYAKKSKTIGNPSKSSMDNINGIPTMVMRGLVVQLKICESCAT